MSLLVKVMFPHHPFTPNNTNHIFKMPTDAQIAGGHKANINNPNTSKESKENSKKVLKNEFNGGDGTSSFRRGVPHEIRRR